MTKILVIGIAGRMGKIIAECIEDTEGVELGGGTEQAGSDFINQDIGEVAGIGKKEITIVDDLMFYIGSWENMDYNINQECNMMNQNSICSCSSLTAFPLCQ